MNLADLIAGKKTTTTTRPATAIPAIPARVVTNQEENEPRIATIATIALADNKQTVIAELSSAGKVSRQTETVSAFCESYGGHCSVKVTGVYSVDCIKIGCEHYKQ